MTCHPSLNVWHLDCLLTTDCYNSPEQEIWTEERVVQEITAVEGINMFLLYLTMLI